jgi:gluconokinase
MHTRPIEILRAALEAVSYRFALIARELDQHAPGAEIIVSGGALAASCVWAQILADVLGRPLHLAAATEASSRGACLLALEARGLIKSIETAPAPIIKTIEPDMAHHARYQEGLERQEKFYARLLMKN